MKKLLVTIALLAVAGHSLFGFWGSDEEGLYRSEDQTELSLLPNKKAVLKEPRSTRTIVGTYEISAGFLYLFLGPDDVRRLQIQEHTFVYDPDKGISQPIPNPAPRQPAKSPLTPQEEADLQSALPYLPGVTPVPTPRPKQTFRHITA